MTIAAGSLSRLCLVLALAAAGLSAAGVITDGASAQSAKTKTKAPAVDGRKIVIEGIKAYEARKDDKAVATLTKAVSSGGLSSQDLAKAFYYRGLAYQRSGKSAQAIADLTNAVWMKGGLTPGEQQKALEVRGTAYAKLGVEDPGPPGTSVGTPAEAALDVASKKTAPVASSPAAAAAAGKDTASLASQGFSTQVAKSTNGSETSGSAASGSSNPLSGVGSFFSNLFSGGGSSSASAEAPARPAPGATASIGSPSSGAAPSAVSAWSSETSVSAANTKTARVAPPKKTKTAVGRSPSGAYKLQVAAVRSRGEAERLAQQLSQKHGGSIGSRVPTISETVFGNMGTFYQVNVGPFAQTSETDKVCAVLKADGFDCLVVEN